MSIHTSTCWSPTERGTSRPTGRCGSKPRRPPRWTRWPLSPSVSPAASTKMLHRRGLTVRPDEDPPPPEAPDPLAGCIQVALGLGHRERTEPALALASDEPPRPRPRDPPLCAIAQGVNVHAGVVVPAGDRAALERLVRYLLRPALSLKRLSLRDDGAVVYRLQRPDRRGRTALVMTPLELLARLAAILPAPRLALRRQLGVFSPGSPDRRKVMPAPAPARAVTPSSRALPPACPGPSSFAACGTSTPCAATAAAGACGPSPSSRTSPRPSATCGKRGVHARAGPGALSRPTGRGGLNHKTPCRTAESLGRRTRSSSAGRDDRRSPPPLSRLETPPRRAPATRGFPFAQPKSTLRPGSST